MIYEKIVKGFVCAVLFLTPFLLLNLIETESITVYKTWGYIVGYAAVIIFSVSHLLVCTAIYTRWTGDAQ